MAVSCSRTLGVHTNDQTFCHRVLILWVLLDCILWIIPWGSKWSKSLCNWNGSWRIRVRRQTHLSMKLFPGKNVLWEHSFTVTSWRRGSSKFLVEWKGVWKGLCTRTSLRLKYSLSEFFCFGSFPQSDTDALWLFVIIFCDVSCLDRVPVWHGHFLTLNGTLWNSLSEVFFLESWPQSDTDTLWHALTISFWSFCFWIVSSVWYYREANHDESTVDTCCSEWQSQSDAVRERIIEVPVEVERIVYKDKIVHVEVPIEIERIVVRLCVCVCPWVPFFGCVCKNKIDMQVLFVDGRIFLWLCVYEYALACVDSMTFRPVLI